MAQYQAYGILRRAGVARAPFLLDLNGATPVAFADGASAADADVTLVIVAPKDGAVSGLGIEIFLVPRPGKDLADVDLTVVINQSGLTEGTTVVAGAVDFIVVELRNGPAKPQALIAKVGQITSSPYPRDPGPPAEQLVDDVYLVEAFASGGAFPVHLLGGLVTGPMILFPGRRITPTGAYAESATTIRGIDLARVRPNPPAGATSPTSATWLDVTATATATGPSTHLTVLAGTPHAGARPDKAPTATVGTPVVLPPSGSGEVLPPLFPGTYRYAVTYAHPNGNETPLGPAGNEITVAKQGAIDLTGIPTGPSPAPAAEYGVFARRIYRQGPGAPGTLDGLDSYLVATLPGRADPAAPATLATTFTDRNDSIDIGGGQSIGAGVFRAPSRLRIRYSADAPLDLDGSLLLVDAGLGSAGVRSFHGTVTGAPTTVEVRNDDRAGLRSDLHTTVQDRARLQWTASAPTPRLQVQLPEIQVDPFDPGLDVRIDAVPTGFGFDWKLTSDHLTDIDVRGELSLENPDWLTPEQVQLGVGPRPIGLVAVRLGQGHPAAAWPEGEATLGIELKDIDRSIGSVKGGHKFRIVRPYGTIAARGLRWAHLTSGDYWPGPDSKARIRADVLLGADPSQPPGGERTMRFLRLVRHADAASDDLRWWGRAGVLPDRLSVDVTPIRIPIPYDQKDVNDPSVPKSYLATRMLLAGEIGRIVGNIFDSVAVADASGVAGDRTWVAADGTGAPEDRDDDLGPERLSLRIYTDREKQIITSTAPLQLEAALRAEVLGRRGVAHARLRLPTDVRLDTFTGAKDTSGAGNDRAIQAELTAGPDPVWGRLAAAWTGAPIAARSNPQVRMRRLPDKGSKEQLDAVTVRFLGLRGGHLKVLPDLKGQGGLFLDPVSKVIADGWLAADRPNRSFRGDQLEIDARVPGGPRLALEGRIGDIADSISVELHKDESDGGKLFFIKADTSSPLTDGSIYALPAQFRDANSPRGEYAGIGNLSLLLDEAPTAVEYVDIEHIPFTKRGLPEYAGAEERPRVHAPSTAAVVDEGGFRLRLTGRLHAHGIQSIQFHADDVLDLEDLGSLTDARHWSEWRETLVPKLDLRPDPAGPGGAQTLWVWMYKVPSSEDDDLEGKAWRFSDGLLADLAVREYKVHDSPDNAVATWDGIEPGTYSTTVYRSPLLGGAPEPEVVTVAYGTWAFDTDLQMKGYRGEITIVDSPGFYEKIGNPYGDWEAGPGEWYLRARDKLKLILYTGDLYMGNTGNGYHVPATNGIFSTLKAPYNLVWPPP